MPDEQVLAWLKTKARVTDAEEQLSDMFDKAERLLRSLRDQPSTPFDPNSWPEGSAVAAALRECREAQRAFDQANAALSPADRKLLKSIPLRFLIHLPFPKAIPPSAPMAAKIQLLTCGYSARCSVRAVAAPAQPCSPDTPMAKAGR
jgi:hypothetical protein